MAATAKIDVESLVKIKLPPLPETVLRISSLLQDVNVSQKQIALAIGCDPMLASRLLRLANSPIYSFHRKVTSLTDAVNAVGNKAIYEIVMVGVVADSFGQEIRNSAVGRDSWLHSLAVAIAARELSLLLKMRGLEEAFSCGLLHDIGKLLLFRADAALYSEIFNRVGNGEGDWAAVERGVLGFDHAEAGALAAHKWNLPEPMCNMILHHHNPAMAQQGVIMTHIINVADQLSYTKNQKLPLEAELLFSESFRTLGFTVEQLETVWEKVITDLREIMKTFF